MRVIEKFFQPLMGSSWGIGERMPLDVNTPRGLFLSDNGNRYVVCDGVGARAAVALQHDSMPEFSHFFLSSEPVDFGTPMGDGRIRLSSILLNQSEGAFPGTLLALEDHIRILIAVEGMGLQWVNIAFGSGGSEGAEYGVWSMDVQSQTFFAFDCRRRLRARPK